jgi:Ca2+-binding RTX toxin-like protein
VSTGTATVTGVATNYVFTAHSNGNASSAGTNALSEANVEDSTQVSVTGGGGDDLLSGYKLNDTISGGAGNDTISLYGQTQDLTMAAGAGAATTVAITINGVSVTYTDDTANANTSAANAVTAINLLTASHGAVASAAANVVTLTYSRYSTGAVEVTDTRGSLAVAAVATTNAANAGDDVLNGDAGNDTIFGGAGADTIDGGTGNDSITGGDGADTINVSSGTDTVVQDGTASGGVTFVNGTNSGNSATAIDAGDTWTFTALDVITGLSTGDTLVLPGTQASAAISVSGSTGTIDVSTGTNGDYAYVRGTYTAGATAGAGTFAYSATGSDWLVLYDDNGQSGTGNVDAVVLVGTATSEATALVPTIG